MCTCLKNVGLPVRLLVAVCVVASSAVIPLPAKNLVKLEMGGRAFVVDIDSSEVQKNLKPANPQAGLSKLPAWLSPSPGQTPLRDNYDVNTGIASTTFAAGGTVDQVIAYYAQLLASKGFPASAPLGQPNSKIVSGKSASATVSVIVNTPFRNPSGGTEISVTYAPSKTHAAGKFETAWFDEPRGILCLRDVGTGEEYYLDARSVVEANLNRPGAVKSEGVAYPSWFPIYPGARRTKVNVIWAYDPTATFQTRDSIRAVYEYYLSALPASGAKILSNGITKSGTPSKDFSAQIVAQMGDDVVDVRTGEIVNLNPFPVLSKEKPLEGTGIGVRYLVPQR